MGTPAFAVPALDRLATGRHSVVAVVTQPDRPTGRGQRLQAGAIKTLASRLGLEVLQPASAKDPGFAERLTDIAPDLAVVVAYGQILPRAILAIPRFGAINAHASLLPHLRGAAPIQRALLRGDSRSGVTVMKINERMDAGDILSLRGIDIGAKDDAQTLGGKLAMLAAEMLEEAVESIAVGCSVPTPQDESLATYAPMLRRAESEISWASPAIEIERQIRAFRPDPGAFTFHDGLRLKVLDGDVAPGGDEDPPGTVSESASGEFLAACGRGALILRRVQPEGGRPMSAPEYFRGKGAARGSVLGPRPQ
jgi:methionyl-tRNA formyltransferase